MSARNPLYAIVLILGARLTAIRCGGGGSGSGWSLPLGRFSAAILIFSAAFNALFVHVGETVIGQLPAFLPLIGGAITLEAVSFGLTNGLVLLALLLIFMAFNAVMPASDLIRLIPNGLRDLAIVLLIAVNLLPQTQRHLKRIRHAQALRGNQLSGWRDWRPIAIPLLIGGLERAMGLAEAMAGRGYGAVHDEKQPWQMRLGLVIGLLAIFGGWLLAFWAGWQGWLLLAAGAAFLLTLLWRSGLRHPRTDYAPRRWRSRDTILLAATAAAMGFFFLPLPGVDRTTLFYQPYPRLSPPPFDMWIGLTLLFVALPAFIRQNDDSN